MSQPPSILALAVPRPKPVPEQRYVFNAATGQFQLHQPKERFVRTILDDLGASTRFQAGAQAERAGLL